jgi:hypothetical protein
MPSEAWMEQARQLAGDDSSLQLMVEVAAAIVSDLRRGSRVRPACGPGRG